MSPILQVALLIFVYMTIIFGIAILKKDNSIVDVFWAIGFIVIAGFTFFKNGEKDLHRILMNLAVLAWGLRLSIHILSRNLGKGEDFRYKAWRDSWKCFYVRSFFQIFMLQGFLMLVIAMPVVLVNDSSPVEMSVTGWLGFVLFLFGFVFEFVGDRQLSEFKKDPANKGRIMTTGLWSITRHPNYFGESLIWWGISLFALDYPGGWRTLVSPVLLTLLLRFVSGVPMLERKYKGRPDWEEYRKKTAAFVPFIKIL
jgi:steroid 5-alpha reductase family enzyme